ncbi:hypothetical protein L596_021116 [Steinernema carpocapsae]|uniref:Uncharacterized protein n=1 Tax=Steinernema carpocapsae TaxID=34508 RepID=A0A4U5MVK3_STECR|nr:hypothetical protein L596_021116 [Steinernema carpocapsae]
MTQYSQKTDKKQYLERNPLLTFKEKTKNTIFARDGLFTLKRKCEKSICQTQFQEVQDLFYLNTCQPKFKHFSKSTQIAVLPSKSVKSKYSFLHPILLFTLAAQSFVRLVIGSMAQQGR